ncbi:hypothetical protein TNCV_4911891 [Trichonephila clavipes]|nr:hypothetical protein TNCV_4911891 [Trichonephila clavipes]
MVNQARYKNNRSIQFSFGVVMLSCKVAATPYIRCYWIVHCRMKQSRISNCLQETKHPVQCGITKEREE